MCSQEKEITEFSAYNYVTKQSKESTRYESRCRPCNRIRRNKRYSDPVLREIDKATSLKWKHENTDYISAYNKMRQQNADYKRDKAKYQRIRSARIRVGSVVKCPEIAAIYKRCVEIEKETGIKHHVDHIMPLSKGGKHIASNLQILTATENLKKGAKIPALPLQENVCA